MTKKIIKPLKIIVLILNYALSYWLFVLTSFVLAWSDYSMETSGWILLIIPLILLIQLFFIIKYWKRPKLYFSSLLAGLLILTSMFLYFYNKEPESSPIVTENGSKNIEPYHSREDFDQSFQDDLNQYFKKLYADDSLMTQVELLREGPTIAGIAYPKFYAWITLLKEGEIIDNGAVRVAEIEVREFQVFDYFTIEEIKSDIDQIYKKFPPPVADKIKEKIL